MIFFLLLRPAVIWHQKRKPSKLPASLSIEQQNGDIIFLLNILVRNEEEEGGCVVVSSRLHGDHPILQHLAHEILLLLHLSEVDILQDATFLCIFAVPEFPPFEKLVRVEQE